MDDGSKQSRTLNHLTTEDWQRYVRSLILVLMLAYPVALEEGRTRGALTQRTLMRLIVAPSCEACEEVFNRCLTELASPDDEREPLVQGLRAGDAPEDYEQADWGLSITGQRVLETPRLVEGACSLSGSPKFRKMRARVLEELIFPDLEKMQRIPHPRHVHS